MHYFLPHRAELGRGRLAYVGAALAFAALPLSGAVQLTVYVATTTVAVQAITALLTGDARPLVVGLIALGAGFLLSMPQILPSIAFVPELLKLPREGFELSVALSCDPRLLPLLVAPHDPLGSAELCSRVGRSRWCSRALP